VNDTGHRGESSVKPASAIPSTATSEKTESSDMLSGENAAFLDEQYLIYLADPAKVDARLAALFRQLDGEEPGGGLPPSRYVAPGPDARSIFAGRGGAGPANASTGSGDPEFALRVARRQSAVVQLINAWRVRGHFLADIDPLNRRPRREHPELTLAWYGLTDADLETEVPTAPLWGMPETAKLSAILAHLRRVYGGSIGAEYMNIDDLTQKRWVQEQLETLPARDPLSPAAERRVLRKLCDAENLERLFHVKFPGTKRFSLEGGETLIALLDMLSTEAARLGVREIVMGMSHRGRLNVLANFLEKPVRMIVDEFQDSKGPAHGSGDVKYHLGYSSDITTALDQTIHLSLTPNPSHLETVDPVVEGRVRAKQDRFGDVDREAAMPVLMHGDAAFIGQGLVAETLQLSELQGYCTGGTIHIVVNNQIGFTTAPRESRSTPYATDVARAMGIPILHVNGEDPRAVAATVQLAVAWRQRFHRDVVIDMYCYRKHGHNEGDEPSFTQPLEYDEIRRRPTPREVFAAHLTSTGHLSAEEAQRIHDESRRSLEAESNALLDASVPVDPDAAPQPAAEHAPVAAVSPAKGRWVALTDGRIDEAVDTAYDLDLLQPLLRKANTLPEGFNAHAKVIRLLEQRLEMAEGRRALDWAMGEQAAFATLVADGIPVRLSGQDSARGTFSQRHALWTDIRTGAEYFPLDELTPDQARFHAIDSNLSEYGVLGFEYGYTLDMPEALVLWEAQFGDFANGAQVIIDQYLSSSEQKWGRCSGLVMLLPHGYEGQGPEHSSARLERYLLLCAQENLQVANVTTPANYFHLLRRQVIRHVRKPLVLMTPKSLLRHALCTSPLSELETGTFQPVIPDPRPIDPSNLRRVVFCSGRVYYELVEHYAKFPDAERIAIHRVELLYPTPIDTIVGLINAAPADAEVVWCQEEPANMGAWPVFQAWLRDIAPGGRALRYVGRPAAASPATGSHRKHHDEQETLISATLTLG
jgi:2-oxoglutarate dehydrogenase E1 component